MAHGTAALSPSVQNVAVPAMHRGYAVAHIKAVKHGTCVVKQAKVEAK
jgi:hypothetical protein